MVQFDSGNISVDVVDNNFHVKVKTMELMTEVSQIPGGDFDKSNMTWVFPRKKHEADLLKEWTDRYTRGGDVEKEKSDSMSHNVQKILNSKFNAKKSDGEESDGEKSDDNVRSIPVIRSYQTKFRRENSPLKTRKVVSRQIKRAESPERTATSEDIATITQELTKIKKELGIIQRELGKR